MKGVSRCGHLPWAPAAPTAVDSSVLGGAPFWPPLRQYINLLFSLNLTKGNYRGRGTLTYPRNMAHMNCRYEAGYMLNPAPL